MDQAKEQIKKKTKVVSVKLAVLLAVFSLTLLIFWFIADEIVLEHESNFDTFIFHKLSVITSPFATKIMLFFTFLGSSEFLLPGYIILTAYYLFFKKNSKLTLNVSAIGLTSTLLLFVFKHIFQRARPIDPLVKNLVGFSFPSGHSFSAFTFFGLIIYILWQSKIKNGCKWIFSVLCFLIALSIATSRVYLHAHFASDVIAGFCLSTMWLIISFWLLNIIDEKYFTKSAS